MAETGAAGARQSDPRTSETVLQRITAIRAPRLLRGLELSLLLFAVGVGVAAVIIVDLTVNEHLTGTLIAPGMLFVVALLGLHVAIRFTAPDADPLILPIAAFLNSIGIAELYRIDLANGDTGWEMFAIKQLVWASIALVAAIVVLTVIRNHLTLYRYTYLLGLSALVLLLLPMVPGLGKEVNGAQVWIEIASFTFQPGEIAKILLAIFFAGYLVRNADALSMVGKKFLGIRFPRARDLGPLIVFWLLAMAVLVFQRLDAVPCDGAHRLGHSGRRPLRGRRLGGKPAHRLRRSPLHELARPVRRPPRCELSAGAGSLRHGKRRHDGHRARSGLPDRYSLCRKRLHLREPRRRDRPRRPLRHSRVLPVAHRPRAAHRFCGPG